VERDDQPHGLPLDEGNHTAIDRLLVEPILAAKYVPETAIPWFDVGSAVAPRYSVEDFATRCSAHDGGSQEPEGGVSA
jgi:hypothetical protein